MPSPSDTLDKLRNHHHKPYVYQPYPKWVTRNNGQKLIVQDEYEHQQILNEDNEAPVAEQQEFVVSIPPVEAAPAKLVPTLKPKNTTTPVKVVPANKTTPPNAA